MAGGILASRNTAPGLLNSYQSAGPNGETMSFFDRVKNSRLGQMVQGIIPSAVSGVTAPHDAYYNGMDEETMRKRAMDLAGTVTLGAGAIPAEAGAAANMGIRVFHGSPHEFDRFDISKIGSGEGAQAYGHGLYFAENEGVAKNYREALAPAGRGNSPEDTAARVLQAVGGNRAAAIEELRARLGRVQSDDAGNLPEALRLLVEDKPVRAGHMYEAEIKAEPHDFLDHDKPFSQQSPQVQERIAKAWGWSPEQLQKVLHGEDDFMRERMGRSYYTDAGLRSGAQDIGPGATGLLKEAGVKGIRYRDQGSRGAGEGSSNYVVFDDNDVETLRRYMGGPGGAVPGVAGMVAPRPKHRTGGGF